MSCYIVGVQQVGTLTVGASGTADQTGTIIPARSNAPFKHLSISIVPMESKSAYYAYVYHDGELVESHDFTSGTTRRICHLAYPNIIFPANIGTNAIPKYFADSQVDFYGVPIRVAITNHMDARATFLVYSCFEEFEPPRFSVLHQES
jgi:hypothetical protein